MDSFYTSNMPSGRSGVTTEHSQHSGKWTVEEKEYADALAAEFQAGVLENCEEGISLRRYLSVALRCSAKRISKKYEGSDYNGKMLYQKCARTISLEEAKERREKRDKLEKRYKESLKVLKMVEDSKQNVGPSAAACDTGLGRLPPSFLQSPSPSAAVSAVGGLVSPHLVSPSAAAAAAELTLQRAAARHAATTAALLSRGVVPRLPFPPSLVGRGARRLSDDTANQDSISCSHHLLRGRAGSPTTALGGRVTGLQGKLAGLATAPLQGGILPAPAMIRQGWPAGQAMLLPNSIVSLHRVDRAAGRSTTAAGTRGGPSSKKAKQNELILAALMNREAPESSKYTDSVAPSRKRPLDYSSELGLPPTSAAKFSRRL